MKHVFRATKIGYNKERDFIYFDSSIYSRETAEAEFVLYTGITQKGYPYTGYEYNGQRYYDITYCGEFENDKAPKNNFDYLLGL